MLPRQVTEGGSGIEMTFAVEPCSLGFALIATTARGVCAVLLGDGEPELVDDLARRFPEARRLRGDETHREAIGAVLAAVDGRVADAEVPLDVRGTAFQQRVWAELRRVRRGECIGYAQHARRIGAPTAARAVAGACAANPLAVLVPCHRVLRKDGSLSGYRWGVQRKRALLEREGAAFRR